jgi:hypothetical protein
MDEANRRFKRHLCQLDQISATIKTQGIAIMTLESISDNQTESPGVPR